MIEPIYPVEFELDCKKLAGATHGALIVRLAMAVSDLAKTSFLVKLGNLYGSDADVS